MANLSSKTAFSLKSLHVFSFLPFFIFTVLITPFLSLYAQETLTLDNCIEIALRENPDLKTAFYQTDIAKSLRTEAYSTYLPNISAFLSSSQTRVGPTINNRVVYQGIELAEGAETETPGFTTNSHYIGASVSQLIFDGGASINRIRQEGARISAARFSQENARSQVILECKRRFYGLRRAEEHRKAAEKSFEVAEQQQIHTRLLFDGGAVPKLDLYQTNVARNDAKIRLLQAESDVDNAKSKLNIYLGREPGAPLSITDTNREVQPLDYDLKRAVEIAYENNPHIRNLKQEVKAGEFGVAVSKGVYFPSVSFSGSYYRYNSNLSKVYRQFDKNYSIYYGLSVSYNLFQGLKRQATIQRNRIQLSVAEEKVRTAERETAAVVESAVRKHKMLMEMLKLQDESMLEAEESVRVAKERYASGQSTLFDVLNAEYNLEKTKVQQIETEFNAAITRAELESLMGRD